MNEAIRGVVIVCLAALAAFGLLVVSGRSGSIETAMLKFFVLTGEAGTLKPIGGSQGAPRVGSNNSVWVSTCNDKTVPIGGSCIVNKTKDNVNATLQNIGVSGQNWECAWNGAEVTEADVRAICLSIAIK
jgi:hypothetical protein